MSGARVSKRTGILLSLSATTGWSDWMHGELWLYPDGLLRIPRGWIKTILSGAYFFNPRHVAPKTTDAAAFARLITDRRNLWVPFDAIVSARLYHTLGADGLRAELANGQKVQLLWLPRREVYQFLTMSLAAELGSCLIVR